MPTNLPEHPPEDDKTIPVTFLLGMIAVALMAIAMTVALIMPPAAPDDLAHVRQVAIDFYM
jgi:hypothetical protein